jgi:hypothetical protein
MRIVRQDLPIICSFYELRAKVTYNGTWGVSVEHLPLPWHDAVAGACDVL